MKRAVVLAAALLLAACTPPVESRAELPAQWTSLTIEAEPVTFAAERVGELIFRGGLALSAQHQRFGGLSGLEVLEGNRMLMVSDRGDWVEGNLVLDEKGALIGVADMRFAPLRDLQGEPVTGRLSFDTEDLTQLPDGRIAVSFEQMHRVLIYDFNRDGPFGAASEGPHLDGAGRLPANASLEAIAVTEAGELIVGAEGGGGPTPLWLAPLSGTEPAPSPASYVLADAYSLTALDRLPSGDIVAVERFFAPVIGPRARIAVFPLSALTPGAAIAPRRLAELAAPMPVDNFEGVSAVRMPDGATRIYIVSDDNFSQRQRTLLLAFDIAE